MNVKEQVLQILQEINPTIADDMDIDLLKEGFIGSFEIVNLVMELEDVFRVEINPEDIIPENFRTIKCIVEMMERLCSN
ncbi:MAG: acyl carrier protein [Lachnospiraceae bacterium]|nr:acyl carrier protein [Lachnospiraceae bacterium]